MFHNGSKVNRDVAFALSSIGRHIGSGQRTDLLSTNKPSMCTEDDLSVRAVPQLLNTL